MEPTHSFGMEHDITFYLVETAHGRWNREGLSCDFAIFERPKCSMQKHHTPPRHVRLRRRRAAARRPARRGRESWTSGRSSSTFAAGPRDRHGHRRPGGGARRRLLLLLHHRPVPRADTPTGSPFSGESALLAQRRRAPRMAVGKAGRQACRGTPVRARVSPPTGARQGGRQGGGGEGRRAGTGRRDTGSQSCGDWSNALRLGLLLPRLLPCCGGRCLGRLKVFLIVRAAVCRRWTARRSALSFSLLHQPTRLVFHCPPVLFLLSLRGARRNFDAERVRPALICLPLLFTFDKLARLPLHCKRGGTPWG
jgi:hypothetical protein